MGKTYKDESFGADGKFRKQQRAHDRTNRNKVNNKAATRYQQTEPVYSESFDEEYTDDKSDK